LPQKKRRLNAFEIVSGLADGAASMSPKWSRRVFWLKFYEGKVSCDSFGLASMRAQCGLGACTNLPAFATIKTDRRPLQQTQHDCSEDQQSSTIAHAANVLLVICERLLVRGFGPSAIVRINRRIRLRRIRRGRQRPSVRSEYYRRLDRSASFALCVFRNSR
jgi:hypothetical protein